MIARRTTLSSLALAGLLSVAGAAHFVVPRSYERIVPRLFGDPVFWVRWSGVAELVCAALVAHPRTRRVGALAAAGLFVTVFPANVKMALDGGVPGGLAWARLPLQVPLVIWAWRVARSAQGQRLDDVGPVDVGQPGRLDLGPGPGRVGRR